MADGHRPAREHGESPHPTAFGPGAASNVRTPSMGHCVQGNLKRVSRFDEFPNVMDTINQRIQIELAAKAILSGRIFFSIVSMHF